MSTYRPMSRSRHIDERVMAVGPIARAVWDYLCCNQQDHASGLYRLSVAAACEDTGWSLEQFESALSELASVGLIECDRPFRLVWVRNMLHKSYPKMSAKQQISVENHLRSMPRSPLVGRFVSYYSTRYGVVFGNIIAPFESHSDGVQETHPNGVRPQPGTHADGSHSDRVRFGSDSGSASDSGSVTARASASSHDSGFLMDLEYAWKAKLEDLGQPRLPHPLAGPAEIKARKLAGLAAARETYGDAVVRDVVLFTAKACTQGTNPAFLARMFIDDGFQARLADYEADRRARRARAEGIEVKRTDDAPRLSSDAIAETLKGADFARRRVADG